MKSKTMKTKKTWTINLEAKQPNINQASEVEDENGGEDDDELAGGGFELRQNSAFRKVNITLPCLNIHRVC